MTRTTLPLLILLAGAYACMAQNSQTLSEKTSKKKDFGLYLGIAPTEWKVGFEWKPEQFEFLGSPARVGLEFGKIFRWEEGPRYHNSDLLDGLHYPFTRFAIRYGVALRPYVLQEVNGTKFMMLHQLELAYLESGRYIHDEGRFSGSSSTGYQEFEDRYYRAGYRFEAMFRLFKWDRLYFSLGSTVGVVLVDRHTYVDGTWETRNDPESLVNESKLIPLPLWRFHSALRFYVWK